MRGLDGAGHVVTRLRVRDDGAVLQEFQKLVTRDSAGTARVIFQAFSGNSLVASPAYVNGAGYGRGLVTITTSQTTVSTSAGQPPYSHVWTNPDPTWSAVNATSSTTSFRTRVIPGNDSSTTFTDTVTDANGNAATITVPAYAVNNYDI